MLSVESTFKSTPLRVLLALASIGAPSVLLVSVVGEVNSHTAVDFARTTPNLLANPHFAGTSGWTIQNRPGPAFSVYDGTTSRLPGSGSIRLVGDRTSVQSQRVAVIPGRTYTFSMYMMTSQMPSLAYCTGVAMDESSNWLRRYGTGYYGASRTGEWEEVAYFYTAQLGEALFMLVCGRYEHPYNPNSASAIWLDDAYFGEGTSLEQPPSPKRPFDGALVRVDALGNFAVNRADGWKPFFPFGIYQAQREAYSSYSEQGFNCIMFNQFSLRAVDAARRAVSSFNPSGMMSMIEIAQYMRPGSLAYGDLDGLERQIGALVRSSSSNNVLAYYWDNEEWSEYAVPQAVTQEIKRLDRDGNGQRIHPILMLQGDSGMLRQYNNMVDLGMTYDQPVANVILQRIQEQQLSWTIVVFSEITSPALLRSNVYRELALGARGIAFYRDPLESGVHIEALPIWQEFPRLRGEVDQLMPILQQPQWTSWSATASTEGLTIGARDYRGEGYLILSNSLDQPVRAAVSMNELPYPVLALVDFFSGQRTEIRSPRSAHIAKISLPAYGVAVYRLER